MQENSSSSLANLVDAEIEEDTVNGELADDQNPQEGKRPDEPTQAQDQAPAEEPVEEVDDDEVIVVDDVEVIEEAPPAEQPQAKPAAPAAPESPEPAQSPAPAPEQPQAAQAPAQPQAPARPDTPQHQEQPASRPDNPADLAGLQDAQSGAEGPDAADELTRALAGDATAPRPYASRPMPRPRPRPSANDSIKSFAVPIMAVIGLLLFFPGGWGIGILTGRLESERESAETMAWLMTVGALPIAIILVSTAGLFGWQLYQSKQAQKK